VPAGLHDAGNHDIAKVLPQSFHAIHGGDVR
jgi:hypothetical protein